MFPGLGLGVIVSRATRITDGMLLAAAQAVAAMASGHDDGAALLPRVADLRETSVLVAAAVARAAEHDGVASAPVDVGIEDRVRSSMWRADYHPVHAV